MARRRDEAAARLPLAEAVALAIETYPMPVGADPDEYLRISRDASGVGDRAWAPAD